MEKKNDNILLSSVAVIAVLGIIIMIASPNANTGSRIGESNLDVYGEAAKPIAPNPQASTKCGDSDGGREYSIAGTTNDNKNSKKDFCRNYDSQMLVEYYCDKNNKIMSEDYNCPYGCKDGACNDMIIIDDPRCGDGKINIGESCEPKVPFNAVCSDFNGFTGGLLTCNPLTCEFDVSQCYDNAYGVCGNGVVEAMEQCDGDNWGSITSCQNLGFQSGTLKCSNCQFDTTQCTSIMGLCGDYVLNPGEDCEPGMPLKVSCTDFANFAGGVVYCNQNCQYDISGCKGG